MTCFDSDRAETLKGNTQDINRTSNPKHGYSEGCTVSDDDVMNGSRFQKLRQTSNTRTDGTGFISVCELQEKVNEALNVQYDKKTQLFDMLLNYKEYFTKQPTKCKLMRYKFEVSSPESMMGSIRPITFAV